MGWAFDEVGDGALVAGIGDQHKEALAEAYRRHGGAVWTVARRICSSAALADEACERIFTDLWDRPGRFDPARGSLRAWLLAQAHTYAVDVVRSQQDSQPDSTPPSAEVELAEHDATLTEAARDAADDLDPAERDALLLTYMGGRSCRDVARLLGVSETTVKSQIRRGLVQLRQGLDAREVTR